MRDTPRTRLLLVVALIAALALIVIDYQNGASPLIRAVKGFGGSVLGGAERAVSSVAGPVRQFVSTGLARQDGGKIGALEQKLAGLRAQLSAAELAKAKYRQLGSLLGIAGSGRYRIVAASVVAFGQGFARTVTLDAGAADGIRAQQTVLDGDGLVGQVIAVSGRTCTVLLADAPSSVIGIRLAPSDQVGWVTGQGVAGVRAGQLVLAVPDPGAVLRPGEQLVTAASVRDRPFVPGVPVGVIAAVRNRAGALTAQAYVRPFADFATLDVVGVVIAPPRANPRFAVLPPVPPVPPRPKPASTAAPRSRPPAGARRGTRSAGPRPGH